MVVYEYIIVHSTIVLRYLVASILVFVIVYCVLVFVFLLLSWCVYLIAPVGALSSLNHHDGGGFFIIILLLIIHIKKVI